MLLGAPRHTVVRTHPVPAVRSVKRRAYLPTYQGCWGLLSGAGETSALALWAPHHQSWWPVVQK